MKRLKQVIHSSELRCVLPNKEEKHKSHKPRESFEKLFGKKAKGDNRQTISTFW